MECRTVYNRSQLLKRQTSSATFKFKTRPERSWYRNDNQVTITKGTYADNITTVVIMVFNRLSGSWGAVKPESRHGFSTNEFAGVYDVAYRGYR
jgi:hypothetical protein